MTAGRAAERARTPASAPLAVLFFILVALVQPLSAQGAFAIDSFTVSATNANGTSTTQAGAHPYAFEVHLDLDTASGAEPLRELTLGLPPGFLVNPTVVSECSAAAFATPRVSPYEASASGESCPNSTQVGIATLQTASGTRTFGLFNLIPPFGTVASLGASPFGTPLRFDVHLSEPDNLVLELDPRHAHPVHEGLTDRIESLPGLRLHRPPREPAEELPDAADHALR